MFKLFRILILAMLTIPSTSYSNVVRVVYFTPTDVPAPTEEELSKIREIMIGSQKFYGDEMMRHGYGAKTFDIETDDRGKIVIHAFNGKHNLQSYTELGMIDEELPIQFRKTTKNPHNIRVIFLSGAERIGAGAITYMTCAEDQCDFSAYIPTENITIKTMTAHEIGHSLELQHNESRNESDKIFLMKGVTPVYNNQPTKFIDFELDDYETRWLDKHKYFNNGKADGGSIKIGSDYILPDGHGYVRLFVDVEGVNELHQAKIARTSDAAVMGWDKVCDTEDTASFRFARAMLRSDEIWLYIIDVEGNMHRQYLTVHLPHIPNVSVRRGKGEDNGDGVNTWASLKIRD